MRVEIGNINYAIIGTYFEDKMQYLSSSRGEPIDIYEENKQSVHRSFIMSYQSTTDTFIYGKEAIIDILKVRFSIPLTIFILAKDTIVFENNNFPPLCI